MDSCPPHPPPPKLQLRWLAHKPYLIDLPSSPYNVTAQDVASKLIQAAGEKMRDVDDGSALGGDDAVVALGTRHMLELHHFPPNVEPWANRDVAWWRAQTTR